MLLMIEKTAVPEVSRSIPEVTRKLAFTSKINYIPRMFSSTKVNKIARTMYEIIGWALQTVVSRNDLAPTVCARLACRHAASSDLQSLRWTLGLGGNSW